MHDVSLFEVSSALLTSPDFQFDGVARVLTPAAGKTFTDALLSEVLQTRLQRHLTFQNNRNEMISIVAKAGRVIAHSDLSADGTIDTHSDLGQQGMPSPNQVKLMVEIDKLTAQATSLKVISRPFEKVISPTSVDFCLAASFQSRQAPSVLDVNTGLSFSKSLSDISLAQLIIDPEGQQTLSGDPEQTVTIEMVAAHLPSMHHTKNRCFVFGTGEDKMHSVVAIYLEIGLVVCLVCHDDVGEVLAQWKNYRARL